MRCVAVGFSAFLVSYSFCFLVSLLCRLRHALHFSEIAARSPNLTCVSNHQRWFVRLIVSLLVVFSFFLVCSSFRVRKLTPMLPSNSLFFPLLLLFWFSSLRIFLHCFIFFALLHTCFLFVNFIVFSFPASVQHVCFRFLIFIKSVSLSLPSQLIIRSRHNTCEHETKLSCNNRDLDTRSPYRHTQRHLNKDVLDT